MIYEYSMLYPLCVHIDNHIKVQNMKSNITKHQLRYHIERHSNSTDSDFLVWLLVLFPLKKNNSKPLI